MAKLLAPPISHFADNELSGAIYDALDKDNPLITRAILAALVPAASVGVLVERYFVNPLLAAPAHLYAFAVLEGRAAEAAASGDVTVAAQTHVEASRQLREAALAIASVLPIGRGAATAERLAARGIVFDGVRGISRVTNVPLWARAQMWVTGAKFEYKFIVNGKVTMVDGFMSRTGERTVKNAADWVLVEVKTDGAIMRALRDPEYASAMINQLERYIKLGKDLEVGGVRYVIVESAEGGPASQMFRTFVEKTYKTLGKSGFLEIYWTPMPP